MGAVRTIFGVLSQGWLWFGLILTPLLAHAGGMGFQLFAFILGCTGLSVMAVNRAGFTYLRQIWLPVFLLFILWAWLTSIWSPYQDARLLDNGLKLFLFSLSLVFIPAAFLRLQDKTRRQLGHVLMAGTVLAAGLMLFDILSGFGLSILIDPVEAESNIYIRQGEAERAIGRGLTSYTHFLWPAIILMITQMKRGWILALTVIIAFSATAVLDRLSLTIPSLVLTGAVVALAWKAPRLGLGLAFGLAMSSLLFAPLIGILSSFLDQATLERLPLSWEHRVRMWAYVWERIQENWLFGNGFDTSRTYQDTFRARDGRDIVIVSLHPHNIGLQIWLETGLTGILLAVGFIAAIIKPVMRFCADPARAAAMAGVIVAASLTGALSIGVWQYWWWGVIALSACMVALIPHEKRAATASMTVGRQI